MLGNGAPALIIYRYMYMYKYMYIYIFKYRYKYKFIYKYIYIVQTFAKITILFFAPRLCFLVLACGDVYSCLCKSVQICATVCKYVQLCAFAYICINIYASV